MSKGPDVLIELRNQRRERLARMEREEPRDGTVIYHDFGRPKVLRLAASAGEPKGTKKPETTQLLPQFDALGRPTVRWCIEAVAKHYRIPPDRIRGPNRKKAVSVARHVAVYLSRTLTGKSLNALGQSFGRRDHTTILSSCNRAIEMMEESEEFRLTVGEIRKKILAAGETER